MAITNATVSVDAVLVDNGNLKSIFENAEAMIGTSTTWVQGDNICQDSSTHLLRRVSSDADGATFVGVAPNAITNGVLVGPYPTGMASIGSQQIQALQGPLYGNTFGRSVVTGDSLTPGCPVYIPATGTTQQVTVTDGAAAGDNVGIYIGPATTAVAGVLYPVLMGYRRKTGDTLQY